MGRYESWKKADALQEKPSQTSLGLLKCGPSGARTYGLTMKNQVIIASAPNNSTSAATTGRNQLGIWAVTFNCLGAKSFSPDYALQYLFTHRLLCSGERDILIKHVK